jgi:Holliday junction resolvase
MNTKRKGNRNEHRTIALLEAAGYRCSRSAASLGDWDVIGIGPLDMVLVQVKTRDFPGSAEMERLQQFPAPANCRKLVHRWRDGERQPDIREVVP